MEFIPRLLTTGRDNFFLLGPRGTGKTSWCAQQYPDALRIDLLNPAVLRRYSIEPEYLINIVEANTKARHIVIDEIQKLPTLLEVVHLLIERKAGQQFILTGSSARKLRRQGVNLLGGRASQKLMYPYMAAELGKRFKLDTALQQGMLPVVWGADNPTAVLDAYNALYLHEEVQAEGLVRNIGAFARFLQAMSFSHATVLNLANVSREAQVSRKTVEGYLEILEDLLLGFRIDVFTRRAKRELAAHPKFYFFDTGVFRANRPAGPLDATTELDGAAIEGLVAQHLHAWRSYSKGKHSLHYWQTRSRTEVDFVIYGESGIYAIEVKNSKRVDSSDLTALKHFAEDYPQSRRYLLYRGEDRIKRDGVLCMPCEEFLLALKPDSFPD
ncbi:MAG: ATP-binding protein [Steroidobacteraceae bacterium]